MVYLIDSIVALRVSIFVFRVVMSRCMLLMSMLVVAVEIGLAVFDDMENIEKSRIHSNKKLMIVNTDAFGLSLCCLVTVSIFDSF